MPRPIHFEIPAENPERAMTFYKAVFGWSFEKWEGAGPYWLISTGRDPEPGIDGGLMARRDPNEPWVNTIGVEDVDSSVAAVEKHGGRCEVPKVAVPGIGWLAYCKDTEGHTFGVMQPDPEVK